jgi:peptidoglycan hydrolase-like protein with peptidoglycan-binding domain
VPSNPTRTYSDLEVDDAGDERRGFGAALWRLLRRSPRDAIGLVVAFAATTAVLVNALYLQPGPHPAPIFSVRSRPVATEPTGSVVTVLPRPRPADLFSPRPDPSLAPRRVDLMSDIQRELSRRGFYEGPVDGVPGPKTEAAIQDFAEAAGVKPTPEPGEEFLRTLTRSNVKAAANRGATASAARPDPIAELIAPSSRRVTAVQRALNEFGYGPIKTTGVLGPETKMGIEKFERERKLPITGQVSERLMRELAATTGRSLE